MDVTVSPMYMQMRAMAVAQRTAVRASRTYHFALFDLRDNAKKPVAWLGQVANGGSGVCFAFMNSEPSAGSVHVARWEHVAYRHSERDYVTCWPANQAPRWVFKPLTFIAAAVASCLYGNQATLRAHCAEGAAVVRRAASVAWSICVLPGMDAGCCMGARLFPHAFVAARVTVQL